MCTYLAAARTATSSYASLPRKNPANCLLVKGLSKDVSVPPACGNFRCTRERLNVPFLSSRFIDKTARYREQVVSFAKVVMPKRKIFDGI